MAARGRGGYDPAASPRSAWTCRGALSLRSSLAESRQALIPQFRDRRARANAVMHEDVALPAQCRTGSGLAVPIRQAVVGLQLGADRHLHLGARREWHPVYANLAPIFHRGGRLENLHGNGPDRLVLKQN